VQDECDCIQECLNRPTTCASYVYKFSTPASVQSGHRTCTLYSQFNLPAGVTLEFDLNSGNNQNINAAEIMALGNNPQAGAPVPQAFMDVTLSTTPDPKAVSGYVHSTIPSQARSLFADMCFQAPFGSSPMDRFSAKAHVPEFDSIKCGQLCWRIGCCAECPFVGKCFFVGMRFICLDISATPFSR
jgi:hypothetical protein